MFEKVELLSVSEGSRGLLEALGIGKEVDWEEFVGIAERFPELIVKEIWVYFTEVLPPECDRGDGRIYNYEWYPKYGGGTEKIEVKRDKIRIFYKSGIKVTKVMKILKEWEAILRELKRRRINYPQYEKEKEKEKMEKEFEGMKKEIEKMREEMKKTNEILQKIGDINQKGGPGSRRKVKDLLAHVGIIPCPYCGKYVCECDY